MYRYVSRESCSQFDWLPLTSLTKVRLVGIVATACRLDGDATDIAPDPDGEASAFREGPPGCAGVLVSSFHLLRDGLIEPLLPVFTPAACVGARPAGAGWGGHDQHAWRSVEAAMFVLHAVSKGLVQFACNQDASRPDIAQRRRCDEMLRRVAAALREGMALVQRGQLAAHPLLVAAGARLFGSIASWAAHPKLGGGAQLTPALEFVIWVLQTAPPAARGHAAKALKKLCLAGRRRLHNAAALAQLSAALDGAVAGGVSTDDCAAIANGIGLIVSLVPKAHTPTILVSLCAPPLARIRTALDVARGAAAAGGDGSTPELLRVTCASMQLLRELVRFTDAGALFISFVFLILLFSLFFCLLTILVFHRSRDRRGAARGMAHARSGDGDVAPRSPCDGRCVRSPQVRRSSLDRTALPSSPSQRRSI